MLRNVARCTVLISTRLNKIEGLLLAEGAADTANAGPSEAVETSREAAIDRDEPIVEWIFTCFFLVHSFLFVF